jgi:LysR family transcriptional activator of nhaA
MSRLNYHHLLYFWTVAREGGLGPASAALHLTPSTLSGQIRLLERQFGAKLFLREGRRLVLTETGRVVQRYADEIFTIGRDLEDALLDRAPGRPLRLDVAASDSLPKLVVQRLLAPALTIPEPVRLVCREGPFERLLAELALHEHDVVLTDAPPPPGSPVRAHAHVLAECGTSFVASPRVAAPLRRNFPQSLDGAPLLVPIEGATLRRSLDRWLDTAEIRPRVVAEFQDAALLLSFGAGGMGVCPVPALVEDDVVARYGMTVVGRSDDVRERFHAITVGRRLRHPAVAAICAAAGASA